MQDDDGDSDVEEELKLPMAMQDSEDVMKITDEEDTTDGSYVCSPCFSNTIDQRAQIQGAVYSPTEAGAERLTTNSSDKQGLTFRPDPVDFPQLGSQQPAARLPVSIDEPGRGSTDEHEVRQPRKAKPSSGNGRKKKRNQRKWKNLSGCLKADFEEQQRDTQIRKANFSGTDEVLLKTLHASTISFAPDGMSGPKMGEH